MVLFCISNSLVIMNYTSFKVRAPKSQKKNLGGVRKGEDTLVSHQICYTKLHFSFAFISPSPYETDLSECGQAPFRNSYYSIFPQIQKCSKASVNQSLRLEALEFASDYTTHLNTFKCRHVCPCLLTSKKSFKILSIQVMVIPVYF